VFLAGASLSTKHADALSGTAEYAHSENIDDSDLLDIEVVKTSFLKRFEPIASESGVNNLHAEVTRGDPGEHLLDYVVACDLDMGVIGGHGISLIKGLLVSSVSSKVSKLSESAVITV